uniref:Uncharacterized protein n=1 Tax=Solanum tuberosum TaxID=4113 RepID=M1DCK8_SOLTU
MRVLGREGGCVDAHYFNGCMGSLPVKGWAVTAPFGELENTSATHQSPLARVPNITNCPRSYKGENCSLGNLKTIGASPSGLGDGSQTPKVPVASQPRQGVEFLTEPIGRIAEPLGKPDLARPFRVTFGPSIVLEVLEEHSNLQVRYLQKTKSLIQKGKKKKALKGKSRLGSPIPLSASPFGQLGRRVGPHFGEDTGNFSELSPGRRNFGELSPGELRVSLSVCRVWRVNLQVGELNFTLGEENSAFGDRKLM